VVSEVRARIAIVERCRAATAALLMIAFGFVVEAVIEGAITFGHPSLPFLPGSAWAVMAGCAAGIAAAAPRWIRSFAAGPLLAVAAWTTAMLVLADWHASLEALSLCLLLGGLPAAFIGTSLPLFARFVDAGHRPGADGARSSRSA
jgi:hypothetical protein